MLSASPRDPRRRGPRGGAHGLPIGNTTKPKTRKQRSGRTLPSVLALQPHAVNSSTAASPTTKDCCNQDGKALWSFATSACSTHESGNRPTPNSQGKSPVPMSRPEGVARDLRRDAGPALQPAEGCPQRLQWHRRT